MSLFNLLTFLFIGFTLICPNQPWSLVVHSFNQENINKAGMTIYGLIKFEKSINFKKKIKCQKHQIVFFFQMTSCSSTNQILVKLEYLYIIEKLSSWIQTSIFILFINVNSQKMPQNASIYCIALVVILMTHSN